MVDKKSRLDQLKIYSGLFETKSTDSSMPYMALDISMMSQPKTINGFAEIIVDENSDTTIKSNFRCVGKNNFDNDNEDSVLITGTGYPIDNTDSYPTRRIAMKMKQVLPNLKIILNLDKEFSKGFVTFKFRSDDQKNWKQITNVPIKLCREGLRRVA